MTKKRYPELNFVPGINTGFTTVGISAFDELRPEAVVRELVQNSLDACRLAKVEKTKVLFRLDRVPLNKIPGIETYRETFNAAMECQKNTITKLPDQAENITNRIKHTLKKTHIDVLSIIDNGIGLNRTRMDALLSDGVSVKENNSSGTFGNGHFTTVPASDLRYILYGGVTNNNDRIGSGHAILASHRKEGENQVRGADGFFIRDHAASPAIYDYATGKEVPELISSDLDRIKTFSDHGTAVLITAFNNFLEEDTLWELVAPGAAANFFIALQEELLEIEVKDTRPGQKPEVQILNSDTLEEILMKHKDNKRSKNFISGFAAYEAYQAYSKGRLNPIYTKEGKVDVYFQEKQDGRTRIDLCRNGMWITKNIPNLNGQFTERIPFHLVLTLDENSGKELYKLIRLAEGPLHESISLKRLDKDQSKRCRNALKEIRDWVLNYAEPIKTDSYTLTDFLTIDFGDNVGISGKPKYSYRGTPVTLTTTPAQNHHDTDTEEGENGGINPNPGTNPRKHPSRSKTRKIHQPIFQVVSCPIGLDRYRIQIDCQQTVSDIELRLIPDEAIDATCDRPNHDPQIPASLSNISIGGSPVNKENQVILESRIVGIRLGKIVKGTTIDIETDCYLEGDFINLPSSAFRIELSKPISVEKNSKTDEDKQ